MTKESRKTYIDILNIIAIIAVIAMHSNAIVHGNPNTRAWNTSLIVECICYFAVPLFFMISGANLMNYREKYDTKTFFKKRVIKVLVPFIFWVIFMFIWKTYIVKTINPIHGFNNIANAFFTNYEETTYYFVWNMLGVYLTIPVLSLLAKEENKKTLWYLVMVYFILSSFVPNILKLFGINYNMDATIQIGGGYIIFVILGWLLSTTDISKKKRYLIYAGAFIGILYRYFVTFVLSKSQGIVVKTIWGYTSWHSILLAASVFLIVKELFIQKDFNGKFANVLKTISSCSFGIYLIHQIIMYYEKTIFNIDTAAWQWRTIGVACTYIICLTIVYIMKKIPIVKKIVP